MWVKWRHGYSSGPGEWEWYYLGDCPGDKKTRSFVQEELVPMWRESGEEWSEHYRGVKFELVETAPKEVIEAKIKRERSKINHAAMNLAMWHKLLNPPEGEQDANTE